MIMKCEAEGVIIVELPATLGITAKGKDFEKREFVMQTTDIYKKMLKFSMISYDGPIVEAPTVGSRVKVRFTVEARESKERWFNDVKAYSIEAIVQYESKV